MAVPKRISPEARIGLEPERCVAADLNLFDRLVGAGEQRTPWEVAGLLPRDLAVGDIFQILED
jgi:hypothetical protein